MCLRMTMDKYDTGKVWYGSFQNSEELIELANISQETEEFRVV